MGLIRQWRMCLCMLLAAILALSLAAPAAYAAPERETVRVGFFPFDGYHMVDEDGNRSGYGYDFLRMAGRYLDVDYEYIGYDRGWDDMLGMLEAGEIDLVTSVQATPERLADFAFSKPIGTSSAMLTVSSWNHTIISGEYRTYNGMRVGLLCNNSRNEDLLELAKRKGFTYTPIYFATHMDLENAMQAGLVDAACTSSLRETQHERVLDLFDTSEFYVIVRKEDTKLLEKINYAIDQMDATEGDWKNALNNKYYEHLEDKDLTFTAKERELIRQYASGEKTLVVTASPDRAPYTYVENGALHGIIEDYFAQLANYIGIPYEIAVPADRQEFQNWQSEGPAQVFIDTRIPSETWMEERGFAYSQPYTTMQLAVVTRRDFDGEIGSLAIASAQGTFGIEEGFAPHAKRVKVDSREDAMQAVLDGRADAAVVYLYSAQQFVNQDQRGLLTYTMLEEPTYEYCVSFTSDVSHELAGIFTKAIYAMPEGSFESIAAEYTSYKAEDIGLLTWIQIYPLTTVLISAGLFLMIVFAVLLIERQKVVRIEKRRAEEAQVLAVQAEQASRAKSDFLANMSHDIRTPMNAIIGFAELMERAPENREQSAEYIRKIKNSGKHLLSLIDDMLDMSRIEANRLTLTSAPVSLTQQIRQAESMVRADAEKRRQTLIVQIGTLSHDAVLADGTWLQRILLNLLSNAVKYTQEGGTIELTLEELAECDGAQMQYRFTVRDNGCGMSPQLMDRLFEPFARGEASMTNKIQGTGLGMPITKNIVAAMGGEIFVESAVGRGSCFTVTLPFAPAPCAVEEEKPGRAAQSALRGKRFLCAEDNEINAEILEAMLDMSGAQCTIYPNGAQLVQAFASVQPGEYDAILMDIQMPEMNGLDATRAIRAGSNPLGRSIHIIAMTANAFEEDVQRSMAAGMNAHISKPIHLALLEDTVAELCGAQTGDKGEKSLDKDL